MQTPTRRRGIAERVVRVPRNRSFHPEKLPLRYFRSGQSIRVGYARMRPKERLLPVDQRENHPRSFIKTRRGRRRRRGAKTRGRI